MAEKEEQEVIEDLTPKDVEDIVPFSELVTTESIVDNKVVTNSIIGKGNKFETGSGNKVYKFEESKGIWLGNQNFDDANFSVDMDGNAKANTFASVKDFEYGENITAGEVVCFKGATTDYLITDFTWANEELPDTTYGDSTDCRVGREEKSPGSGTYWNWIIYFKLPTIPDNISKVELILSGNSGSTTDDLIVKPCATDITESTLDWTEKPADDTSRGESSYFRRDLQPQGTKVDITEMVRYMKAGLLPSTSFSISKVITGTEEADIRFYTDDSVVSDTYKPKVRVTGWDDSDSTLYLADSSDYNLCRNVIGIAKDTKIAGSTGQVFVNGIVTGLSAGVNEFFYLSNTPGAITPQLTNVNTLGTIVPIGKGLSSSEMLLAIDRPREVLGWDASVSYILDTTVLTPYDGEYSIVKITTKDGQGTPTPSAAIKKVRLEREETLRWVDWDYSGNIKGADMTFTWNNNNTISIVSSARTDLTFNFYNR